MDAASAWLLIDEMRSIKQVTLATLFSLITFSCYEYILLNKLGIFLSFLSKRYTTFEMAEINSLDYLLTRISIIATFLLIYRDH